MRPAPDVYKFGRSPPKMFLLISNLILIIIELMYGLSFNVFVSGKRQLHHVIYRQSIFYFVKTNQAMDI